MILDLYGVTLSWGGLKLDSRFTATSARRVV